MSYKITMKKGCCKCKKKSIKKSKTKTKKYDNLEFSRKKAMARKQSLQLIQSLKNLQVPKTIVLPPIQNRRPSLVKLEK